MTGEGWLTRIAVAVPSVVLAVVAFAASTSQSFRVDWYTVAAAGGLASSQTIVLQGTGGQAAVGGSSSDSYRLGAGYWGDTSPAQSPHYGVYLPLVVRSIQ
jgi:hypothetical protein